MGFMFSRGEIGLEAACKFAAGKHDAPSAAFALKPDICAETDYGPLIGSTGMRLAQAQMIMELQVGEHGKIIPRCYRVVRAFAI